MPPIGPTTNTTRLLAAFALLWLFAATATLAAERVVDVRDCGAVGDGKTLATEAIQKAIDRCADQDGRRATRRAPCSACSRHGGFTSGTSRT